MAKHTPMTTAMLERVAEQFRALGEPSRLRLMNLLFERERTVGDLVETSGLSLANTSKHLGLLHRSGWVTRRKDGLNVVYGLADERTMALCEMMCSRVRGIASNEAALIAPPAARRTRRAAR